MLRDTPTSLVVIMSMLVLYLSNTLKTLHINPVASSIRELTILITVMLSLAATALMRPSSHSLLMSVPGAWGAMVFFRRTGTPA